MFNFFSQVAEGLMWFCNHDLVSAVIFSTQNYVLYPYLPYSFVMWHFLYAGLAWPKLNFPNTNYEVRVKIIETTYESMNICSILHLLFLFLSSIVPNFSISILLLVSSVMKIFIYQCKILYIIKIECFIYLITNKYILIIYV